MISVSPDHKLFIDASWSEGAIVLDRTYEECRKAATLKHQSGPNKGSPVDSRAIHLICQFYGKDWNNSHQSAAEEISNALNVLDGRLKSSGGEPWQRKTQ